VKNSLINIYDKNGNLLESDPVHTSLQSTNDYFILNSSTGIGKVSISSTGTNESGQNGTMTITPWAALVTDIAVSNQTPEPGTMALLGFGLAGVTVFARRRKA
jgi:hypothetical protein